MKRNCEKRKRPAVYRGRGVVTRERERSASDKTVVKRGRLDEMVVVGALRGSGRNILETKGLCNKVRSG